MTKHILIAEDDEFLTKMYRIQLEQDNWEVQICRNGEEAIASIEKQQPDIALLDLLMPKIDGYGVLEHIKAKGYNFPVLVLSNLSQGIDQSKCKELGAVDYFVKSEMEMDELAEKINQYTK